MTTMMTTMWKAMKRKNLRNPQHSVTPPARRFRHRTLWSIAPLVCLAGSALIAIHTHALGTSSNALAPQKKPSPNDCILYVTVFTDQGARLPDAAFTAHATGKNKPHWDGYSDSRGEFAVRVSFQGDYEIEVKAKGYDPQTRKVTSEVGQRLDVVFNLVPRSPKKP
jgi:hypothetical protein